VSKRFSRTGMVVVLLGALLGLTGCGGNTTTVNGTVTFKSKAVTNGSVTLMAPDGGVHQAEITNGSFTISNVPLGTHQVGVSTTNPNAPKGTRGGDDNRGKSGPPPADFVAVPEKYLDAKSSGVTVTIDGSGVAKIALE
jgi:hypothetical protein